MCNDFGNHIPYDAYLQAVSHIRVPVRVPTAAPNLEPRRTSGRPIPPPSMPLSRHPSRFGRRDNLLRRSGASSQNCIQRRDDGWRWCGGSVSG
jgi:hypothetical protein